MYVYRIPAIPPPSWDFWLTMQIAASVTNFFPIGKCTRALHLLKVIR